MANLSLLDLHATGLVAHEALSDVALARRREAHLALVEALAGVTQTVRLGNLASVLPVADGDCLWRTGLRERLAWLGVRLAADHPVTRLHTGTTGRAVGTWHD